MAVQVVLVHGIRTSATMWRAQVGYLQQRGNPVTAVDLPGHGTRRGEEFTLDEAFATIDRAVQDAATRGPVLLVGHSMGGLLSIDFTSGGRTRRRSRRSSRHPAPRSRAGWDSPRTASSRGDSTACPTVVSG